MGGSRAAHYGQYISVTVWPQASSLPLSSHLEESVQKHAYVAISVMQ